MPISIGTAITAPAMPHSQPQNITNRKTANGLGCSCRPATQGLTRLLSTACNGRKASAGAAIALCRLHPAHQQRPGTPTRHHRHRAQEQPVF